MSLPSSDEDSEAAIDAMLAGMMAHMNHGDESVGELGGVDDEVGSAAALDDELADLLASSSDDEPAPSDQPEPEPEPEPRELQAWLEQHGLAAHAAAILSRHPSADSLAPLRRALAPAYRDPYAAAADADVGGMAAEAYALRDFVRAPSITAVCRNAS